MFYCPKCSFETDTLHEGYCKECSEAGQRETDAHNLNYTRWSRLSDDDRKNEIRTVAKPLTKFKETRNEHYDTI